MVDREGLVEEAREVGVDVGLGRVGREAPAVDDGVGPLELVVCVAGDGDRDVGAKVLATHVRPSADAAEQSGSLGELGRQGNADVQAAQLLLLKGAHERLHRQLEVGGRLRAQHDERRRRRGERGPAERRELENDALKGAVKVPEGRLRLDVDDPQLDLADLACREQLRVGLEARVRASLAEHGIAEQADARHGSPRGGALGRGGDLGRQVADSVVAEERRRRAAHERHREPRHPGTGEGAQLERPLRAGREARGELRGEVAEAVSCRNGVVRPDHLIDERAEEVLAVRAAEHAVEL